MAYNILASSDEQSNKFIELIKGRKELPISCCLFLVGVSQVQYNKTNY